MLQETRKPRRHFARLAIAAVIDFAVIGGDVFLGMLIASDYDKNISWLLSGIPAMAVTAWLAPKASYRRRDALLWLTGFGGLYVIFKVAWRVAYLPHRDWPPRDDEVPRAQYLKDPQFCGVWVLRDSAGDRTAAGE